MVPIYRCKGCKKQRRIGPQWNAISLCIACLLKQNNALLIRAFSTIIEQPEMKAFRTEMEQWYV